MQSVNELSENKKKLMSEALAEETKNKAEVCKGKAQQFASELQAEVEAIAQQVDAVREKIKQNHVSGNGDCILKANIAQYEKCVPQVNVD